jgi:hypothetical protein
VVRLVSVITDEFEEDGAEESENEGLDEAD